MKYVSWKLIAGEKLWAIPELVALAIVWSVQKLSRSLLGKHFFICTDHKGLTVMTSDNAPKNKQIFFYGLC